jgi:hypothetical protein
VIVPWCSWCVAATAFFARDSRTGVFALLGAIGAAALLPGARGPLGTTPLGALERAASRSTVRPAPNVANVRLRELYVAPMRAAANGPMLSRFNGGFGSVMVTDESASTAMVAPRSRRRY